MRVYEELSVSVLLGKTLVEARNLENREVAFATDTGERYKLHHYQDCCENVLVEDIDGDLSLLVGSPITMAEESSQSDPAARDSGRWTFYRFATAKGYVTIRWHGTSNGYYSESVSFESTADA